LIVLARIFLKMFEVKLFFIEASTELMYSAIYMLLENIFMDFSNDIDEYIIIFKQHGRKFRTKKILKTIIQILNIIDDNIMGLMELCYKEISTQKFGSNLVCSPG